MIRSVALVGLNPGADRAAVAGTHAERVARDRFDLSGG
jgi:hypothetical protein